MAEEDRQVGDVDRTIMVQVCGQVRSGGPVLRPQYVDVTAIYLAVAVQVTEEWAGWAGRRRRLCSDRRTLVPSCINRDDRERVLRAARQPSERVRGCGG